MGFFFFKNKKDVNDDLKAYIKSINLAITKYIKIKLDILTQFTKLAHVTMSYILS